jgi:hypothetical protein
MRFFIFEFTFLHHKPHGPLTTPSAFQKMKL